MNQRGFSILYLLAGLAVVTLVGSIVYSYNEGQRAKAELSICQQRNSELNALIVKQNEAVRMVEDTAAKAQARSKKAQETARNAVAATLVERDRLAKAAKAGGSCLDGVKAVRDGLSK